MERRDFVKQGALFIGGSLLHTEMAKAFSSLADDRINIGIIGSGDRGRGLIQVLKEFPDKFQITALCEVLDFRLKQARDAVGSGDVKTYKDYRKMLDDKALDAVVIATPLYLHYAMAKDALAAGKHIYLEKTMTFTSQQALDLVNTSSKYPKQVLQVGHQYRYTPLYYKIKEMIGKGYLGKVTQIDCRWDRNWNWRRAVPDSSLERQINWRMYREYSGGLTAELLSHQMDFINWAFNTVPQQVIATGGIDNFKDGRETFDNVQVMLRYNKEGMIGNFGATCSNARDGYMFRIKGTKGTVSLLTSEGTFYPENAAAKELGVVDGVTGATKIIANADGGIPILKEPIKDGTWYAFQDFYRAIAEQKQPASNVYTGASASFCVHLANESMYTNTIQPWKKDFNLVLG